MQRVGAYKHTVHLKEVRLVRDKEQKLYALLVMDLGGSSLSMVSRKK